VILGVDPGERRVGLAIADSKLRFAHALEVIDVRAGDPMVRIAEIVGERGVTTVVVGKPLGLRGVSGAAVAAQKDFTSRLRAVIDVVVTEYDERLTTVVAERALRSAGAPAAVRRGARDAVAAQVMLQGFLDATG
jgi:putative holliday junction resolvase